FPEVTGGSTESHTTVASLEPSASTKPDASALPTTIGGNSNETLAAISSLQPTASLDPTASMKPKSAAFQGNPDTGNATAVDLNATSADQGAPFSNMQAELSAAASSESTRVAQISHPNSSSTRPAKTSQEKQTPPRSGSDSKNLPSF